MTDRELMQMAQNTDRELWREREGDFYADSIHVTKDGGIGMNVGGTVFVMTIKAWHAAAALRDRLAQPEPEPVAIGEEWKPCVKLPIVVHVREQRKGETHVSTREGITPVKEDDLIMRGVAGEEYPIGRELFNSTYTFDTAPVHTIDISQKRVDETAKRKHEWVGLTDEEINRCYADTVDEFQFYQAIEAKLKEKNT